MNLQERFYEVLANWNEDRSQGESQWNELRNKYCDSSRHYHDLNHLRELFKYFDRYKENLNHPEEVAYAIFYHDIIYNIWSKNNELNSGELAMDYLLITYAQDRAIERVFNLIMGTKDHSPKMNTDEKWMVDFDLGILGQSWDKYHSYTKQIREEYGSVPNFMYKRGRKKVLRQFLNKNRIYKTDAFYQLFENNARNNIKRELEIL